MNDNTRYEQREVPLRERLDGLSGELVEKWRGPRTQLELSAELGFQSNVVAHWERGRRHPRTSLALRAAALDNPGVLVTLPAMFDSDWTERVNPASPDGVALLLGDALGGRTLPRAAAQLAVSRSTLSRWLNGRAEPTLSQFLACMALVGRLDQTIAALSGQKQPWIGEVEADVLMYLQLPAYTRSASHSDALLCQHLVLSPAELELALGRLREARLITRRGPHWATTNEHFVQRSGGPGVRQELRRRVARRSGTLLQSTVPLTFVGFTAAVGQRELELISSILREAHERVFEVARQAESAERLVKLTVGVLPLDGLPPQSSERSST